MISSSKRFWLSAIVFFIIIWYRSNFRIAQEAIILIYGNISFIIDVICMYTKLKNVHFNFRQAATKKKWIQFSVTSLSVWALFFTLKSEYTFWMAVITPILVLAILLIYDLLVSYIKRI